jgi:hypothetical protein
MKQLILKLLVAAGLLVPAVVRANLGDTTETAQERWGKPVAINNVSGYGKAYNYLKKGWQMLQYYNSDGIAYWCCYYKLDGSLLTKAQAELVDRSNFKVIPNSWTYQTWKDTDTARSTSNYYDSSSGYQLVTSWSLLRNRWVSSRTVIDNSIRPNTNDSGSGSSNDTSDDAVPM